MQEKIKELFSASGTDSALFRTFEYQTDPSFYYFTQLPRSLELSSFLVLRRGRKPLILTSKLEYGALKGKGSFDVALFSGEKELAALLRTHLGRRVGIDFSSLTLARHKALRGYLPRRRFVDISRHLAAVRATKTTQEIRKLKEACAIAEEIIAHVASFAEPGMRECDVAFYLESMARKLGQGTAFPTIVAAGRNSAVPHHITGTSKLRKHAPLLIDFGVLHQGYCSDLTRTFSVGAATQKQRDVYAAVYKAQRAALRLIRDGAAAQGVAAAAHRIIKSELRQDMIHGLGHGIGIVTHDFPQGVNTRASYKLRSGMCITVEPGYYNPRTGGVRIEDDVLVAKNKAIMLSDAPAQLVEL